MTLINATSRSNDVLEVNTLSGVEVFECWKNKNVRNRYADFVENIYFEVLQKSILFVVRCFQNGSINIVYLSIF